MGDEITGLLGVDAPIVLGPFGGLSSVTLTAAVSELGGLGSYGLYGYSGERILETAAEIRDFTSKPFALNLWLPLDEAQPADVSTADYARYAKALEPFFDEVGIEVPPQPAQYLRRSRSSWRRCGRRSPPCSASCSAFRRRRR